MPLHLKAEIDARTLDFFRSPAGFLDPVLVMLDFGRECRNRNHVFL